MDLKYYSLTVTALCFLGLSSVVFGETESPRYLIIHADDAGMSHSVNLATIQAMEDGLVTSASIMVPCPWFKEFAEYAREHPERDFGIHLTLNSEWDRYRWGPVAPRNLVPSLVDEEGYLWDNVSQVKENAKAAEVEIELRAQIDRARRFGVPLSHLDTHMGAVMSRPDLIEIYVKLGIEYELPVLFLRTIDENTRQAYPALADKSDGVLERLDERGLPVLDHLLQFYDGDNPRQREQRYLEALKRLRPGVTQLIVHCGYNNEELRAITSSSFRRDQDRRVCTSRVLREQIDTLGIELIGWGEFRRLVTTAK